MYIYITHIHCKHTRPKTTPRRLLPQRDQSKGLITFVMFLNCGYYKACGKTVAALIMEYSD